MKLFYATDKIEAQCTNVRAAKKLFGGDAMLAKSLLARINALKAAESMKDIIVQPLFHFHKLSNKNGRNLNGYYAIDVKSRREQWRIILELLDEYNEPYDSGSIDKIAENVKIIEIMEVSKHYV